MPAQSRAQFRWLHTPSAKRALGAAGQKEWLASSSPKGLPERVPEHKYGSKPVTRST